MRQGSHDTFLSSTACPGLWSRPRSNMNQVDLAQSFQSFSSARVNSTHKQPPETDNWGIPQKLWLWLWLISPFIAHPLHITSFTVIYRSHSQPTSLQLCVCVCVCESMGCLWALEWGKTVASSRPLPQENAGSSLSRKSTISHQPFLY